LLWGAAGFWVVLIGLGAWDIFRDAPAPDDADLLISFKGGPNETNGFRLIEGLVGKLKYPHSNSLNSLRHHTVHGEGTMTVVPQWNMMRDRLPEVGPILDAIDPVLEAEHFSQPTPEPYQMRDYLSALTTLDKELEARMELHLHDKKYDAAWKDAHRLFRLHHRILEQGNGLPHHYLYDLYNDDGNLYHVQKNLLALAPVAATTRTRTDQLARCLIGAETFRQSIRWQYTESRLMVLHKYREYSQTYGLLAPVFFKTNRVLTVNASVAHETLGNFGKPLTPSRHAIRDSVLEASKRKLPPKSINHLGIEETGDFAYTFKYVDNLIYNNSKIQLTRLGLALAGYANEHGGNLPASLKDLTPNYISSIPNDPITEQPFNYDPAFRRIWSVGDNLINDGGDPDPNQYLRDFTLRLFEGPL